MEKAEQRFCPWGAAESLLVTNPAGPGVPEPLPCEDGPG
jgi:hypothetical protein